MPYDEMHWLQPHPRYQNLVGLSMKNLKEKIQNGETLLGCWLNTGSSITAEIVGSAGFDWVLIDMEHGAGSEKDVLHQIQALEHTNSSPIVRVESNARQRFHRMLDYGAEGIMCPRIDTVEDAQQAAAAMRYQPEGTRGAAMMVRATQFGANFKEYYEHTQHQLVGIIQIESTTILSSLNEVAEINAVDVLFIGPLDLSTALGIPGQTDHSKFIEAAKATVEAANKHGKQTGILLKSPDEFSRFHDLGFRFIACGSDAGFVRNGAVTTITQLRKLSE